MISRLGHRPTVCLEADDQTFRSVARSGRSAAAGPVETDDEPRAGAATRSFEADDQSGAGGGAGGVLEAARRSTAAVNRVATRKTRTLEALLRVIGRGATRARRAARAGRSQQAVRQAGAHGGGAAAGGRRERRAKRSVDHRRSALATGWCRAQRARAASDLRLRERERWHHRGGGGGEAAAASSAPRGASVLGVPGADGCICCGDEDHVSTARCARAGDGPAIFFGEAAAALVRWGTLGSCALSRGVVPTAREGGEGGGGRVGVVAGHRRRACRGSWDEGAGGVARGDAGGRTVQTFQTFQTRLEFRNAAPACRLGVGSKQTGKHAAHPRRQPFGAREPAGGPSTSRRRSAT